MSIGNRLGLCVNARGAWPSYNTLLQLGNSWLRTIVYDYDELDKALAQTPPNVRIIALLNSENNIVNTSGGTDPLNLDGFEEACRQFAIRFAGRVQAVECLNEWDLLGYDPFVAADCAMIGARYFRPAGIKTLVGSVTGPEWFNAIPAATGFLTNPKLIDGFAFHPYGKSAFGHPPDFIFGEIDEGVRMAHDLAGRLPIWLTEFGAPLGQVGWEAGQEKYLRLCFQKLGNLDPGMLAASCYFCFSDQMGMPHERDDFAFGLHLEDGTPRPAWKEYLRLAGLAAQRPWNGW